MFERSITRTSRILLSSDFPLSFLRVAGAFSQLTLKGVHVAARRSINIPAISGQGDFLLYIDWHPVHQVTS
jgi:hypothetical protein